MKPRDLNSLKEWFVRYTDSFSSDDHEDRQNILLKVEHTYQVCRNIVFLAESLLLPKEEVLTAEAVGLFHDIGRFPQYARFRTFRDGISVNHGKLGAETLSGFKTLMALPAQEQSIILYAVQFHNAFSLAAAPDRQHLLFLKLVRDADKLDIWRVFSEYFEQPAAQRATAVGLGLPDLPGCSEKVLSCLFENRPATLADIKTLNDFKLMQISWVFDLNFRTSFVLLRQRGDFSKVVSLLPQNSEISRAVAHASDYIEGRLNADLDRIDN